MITINNKMRIYSDRIKDITIIEKFFRLLTPKFNLLICSIKEAKDIDELQSSLLIHEQKLS